MRVSRTLLRGLIVLACPITPAHITAAQAAEPGVVFGAGTTTCNEYVAMLEQHKAQLAGMVLSWTQGYFSGRNTAGRTNVAVGGTLSAESLESKLADQCREGDFQPLPVVIAVQKLYDSLRAKGL
jgi:hypothetical protein